MTVDPFRHLGPRRFRGAALGTRRERIIAVLTEYPQGGPTPLIARLAEEDMADRTRALQKCWVTLRQMEARGEVARVPTTGRESEWRLVPARLRPIRRAIGQATAAWESLTVQEWAALGFPEEAWQEFIGHYQALFQRELAGS